MQIIFTEFAEQNLIRTKQFYQQHNQSLAEYFIESVFADIESLTLHYEIHAKVNNFYRLLVKNFPYSLYYKVKSTDIIVYAVLE